MASGSHNDEFDPEIRNEINVEEDEIDESYAPDKDDDFVEYNYDGMELEDENWEFENDFISVSEGVGHEYEVVREDVTAIHMTRVQEDGELS
ncbi:hypothetical protein MRB53_017112 [Persea americana]|uniref:Uncharacterized protein n=1 Tax=Persea americana TaxID=3435 RepID=A0ACC2M447_PERAE|nr:hypothetical protein MRB53_017112 [Persea americana]